MADEPGNERVADFMRRVHSPDMQKAFAADEQEKAALRKATVDQIAENLLGIRPEHGDTIYTQHPINAGVMRRALALAFDAGGGEAAKAFLAVMLEADAKRRGQ